MKAFGLSLEEALHGVSYANIVLLSATLPPPRAPGRGEAPVDAGDPRNAAIVIETFRE